MKKRQLFLDFLKRILIGNDHPAIDRPHLTASPTPIDSNESDQKTLLALQGDYSSPQPVVSIKSPPMNLSRDKDPAPNMSDFPPVSEEIKELLGSSDWDEVNQGLELLAASCGTEQIKAFAQLIDPTSLSVRNQLIWQTILGINENNALNAVAKLAGLSGALAGINTIVLNSANYAASEIQLNVDSLADASQLRELVTNGIELSGLGALGSFGDLEKLILVSGSIDWDSDEDAECFLGLKKLRFLTISSWPWEDLRPLSACTSLDHLDLRGGELESLLGVDSLSELHFIALSDFYSLSSLEGLDQLTQLQHLSLSGLSVGAIEQVGMLSNLQTFAIEASEEIDLSPLGLLSSLRSVDINCDAATSVGILALCPDLQVINLGSIPTYKIGELAKLSFGSFEFVKLMALWKGLKTPAKQICNSYSEANNLGVFLFVLNLLECLSAQIDITQLRSRFDRISSRYGEQLCSRCYWPQAGSSLGTYPQSHPVGVMMHRALSAGCLDRKSCNELSALLTERLPKAPIR